MDVHLETHIFSESLSRTDTIHLTSLDDPATA
jgi:hypothetical protein